MNINKLTPAPKEYFPQIEVPRKSSHPLIRLEGRLEEFFHGGNPLHNHAEFRTEAEHCVFDVGRTVRHVARELSVLENSLSKWDRDERRRLETMAGTGEEPLTPAERSDLVRLRRENDEMQMELALLGKAVAYFASNPQTQRDLR
jgi:transposase-like protein